MTEEQFIKLLPMACAWVQEQEQYILEQGIPLTEDQQIDAYQVGVQDITKVRLLYAAEVPVPTHPELKLAAEWAGLLSPVTAGTSFRYGIFIRDDFRDERSLVAHELTHTMQYERLGGFQPFLESYLKECLTIGYPDGPLEQEARQMEKRFRS